MTGISSTPPRNTPPSSWTGRLVGLLRQCPVPLVDCQDPPCAGTDPADRVLDVHIPEHHGVVVARGGKGVPVGAERDVSDGPGVPTERLAGRRLAEVNDVPQPDRAVNAS